MTEPDTTTVEAWVTADKLGAEVARLRGKLDDAEQTIKNMAALAKAGDSFGTQKARDESLRAIQRAALRHWSL